MSTAQVSGGFFEGIGNIASNTDQLFEGIFWGSWCSLNVYNWTAAKNEKHETERLPESAEKADKLWFANKKLALSSCSVVSGISMVTCWMEDVGLMSLGSIGPWISSFGYGGSGIVSTSKLWDSLREFDQGIVDFNKAGGPREKMDIALKQVEVMVRVAFFATFAAWGFFGALHALYGGEALFYAMDTSLYYGLFLFFSYLATAISIPILRKTT